jgi:predicted FMN-binding regulatory protein PaiB
MIGWSFLFVSVAGTQRTCNADNLVPVSISYSTKKNEVPPVAVSTAPVEGYRQNKAIIIGVIVGVIILIAILK